MIARLDMVAPGREWAESLLPLGALAAVQFWAAAFVFAACLPQLQYARKFRYPIEGGRLQVLGDQVGLRLRSSRLALRLGEIGRRLDFAAAIIGRVGIAMQASVALFAIEDAALAPDPLLTGMLFAIALIQVRSLTAHSPRPPRSLP